MKKITGAIIFRSLLVFLLFLQAAVKAQDSTTSSHSESVTKSTTTTTNTWYMQPWVWVVGAAVFVIILVALFRGNSSRTDVSRSTTVIKSDKEY
jgi:H+/Cl- antiporter ClcA